ncbi:MAG TPA: MraY family glycosyltransferase [Saprospiraceae bacterium]|jgi:UDP-N-acetylmuramyl pentapeptide phosphotransferase/UDP-N-acetylglucosamine-1-phosphate transferase|nr:MraY family glycosyltransferase [Saprospiraceae bacterium]
MYYIILAFITSFALTYLAIPSIIHIAVKKNLMDEPGDRRSHKVSTPSLGGIGIFAGTVFSIILWTPFNYFGDLQYILCAFIIIFLIGAKDDIDPMSPSKKFLGELFAAGILVFRAKIKLTSLYGFFGIYAIPEFASIILSIFTIIVIINAFNLIDGINGLSASLGLLITFVLGIWFLLVGSIEISIVAFALCGALVAFLKYNITPAKIFMGDTGALLLGTVCSILAIKFIELHNVITDSSYTFSSAPSVAIAILILPLFDTLRVFVLRLMEGKSPFNPDRKHIHHIMIDLGLTHMQATGVLFLTNILFIILAVMLQNVGNLMLLIIILGLALGMSYFASMMVAQKKSKTNV